MKHQGACGHISMAEVWVHGGIPYSMHLEQDVDFNFHVIYCVGWLVVRLVFVF
jgi:hypothetical protein